MKPALLKVPCMVTAWHPYEDGIRWELTLFGTSPLPDEIFHAVSRGPVWLTITLERRDDHRVVDQKNNRRLPEGRNDE